MLQSTPGRTANPIANDAMAGGQHRRFLIALLVLMVAISVVIVKDQNWFGSDDTAVAEDTPESTPVAAPTSTTPSQDQVASQPVAAKPVQKASRSAVQNAAERERIPAATSAASQHVDASYPLLDGQTAIQGSVLMQALIGADGAVEDTQVLSGPTILVSAAREAVRQWKFKPYYLNGQAVETQARVTVNFKIKVSDTVAKYQVDSVTSNGAL